VSPNTVKRPFTRSEGRKEKRASANPVLITKEFGAGSPESETEKKGGKDPRSRTKKQRRALLHERMDSKVFKFGKKKKKGRTCSLMSKRKAKKGPGAVRPPGTWGGEK